MTTQPIPPKSNTAPSNPSAAVKERQQPLPPPRLHGHHFGSLLLGAPLIAGHAENRAAALPRKHAPQQSSNSALGEPADPKKSELLVRVAADEDREEKKEKKGDSRAFDPLDPSARHAAQLAPPLASSSSSITTPDENIGARARVSMEELLPQLVRRIAWAGDRKRGTVQLELGAGRHEGTVVTVHADAGRVRIVLSGKSHNAQETEELRARIDARLRRHGVDVESVT